MKMFKLFYCGISSGPSLFAKILVYGFPRIQRVKKVNVPGTSGFFFYFCSVNFVCCKLTNATSFLYKSV